MVEQDLRHQPAVQVMPGIELLHPMARFILQADRNALLSASKVWPGPFSSQACRSGTGPQCATLWLGPDEYLLLHDEAREANAWFERIEAAIGDQPHSLVDVSHRQCALLLRRDDAQAVLNSGCPSDLDASAFPIGMCTRTVFAKADIVLWRKGEHEFHIEIWRSFLDYVAGSLEQALVELA